MRPQDPMKMPRIIGWVFTVFGSMVAIAGMWDLIRTCRFVMRAVSTPGMTTRIMKGPDTEDPNVPEWVRERWKKRPESDWKTTGHPSYTFRDAAGNLHRGETESPKRFGSEQEVTVIYDPANPEHSNIDTFVTVWGGPLAFTAFGAIFAAFGGVVLRVVWRQTGDGGRTCG